VACPQEVIEVAIAHPADSTAESRRAASSRVVRALAANEYGFVRRPRPLDERMDGQCPMCLTENVHVDHGPAYTDALDRATWLQQRNHRLEAALRAIVDAGGPAGEIAMKALL